MNNFSFDATAGASQSTNKPKLKGNEIHTVKFDECEIQDIKGVKDPSALYKVIKFKYSNEDGNHEHTVFEPRPDDFKRTESEYTDKKTGKINKIPQPSNVETMMLFFKHNIDAFVPAIAEKIDNNTASLNAANWDDLRKLVLKIMEQGKGTESKIKLMNNKDGEGRLPGFFAGISREGKVYMRNNFIGNKIAFTPYEITKVSNAAKAKVSPPPAMGDDLNLPESSDDNLDLGFDVEDL